MFVQKYSQPSVGRTGRVVREWSLAAPYDLLVTAIGAGAKKLIGALEVVLAIEAQSLASIQKAERSLDAFQYPGRLTSEHGDTVHIIPARRWPCERANSQIDEVAVWGKDQVLIIVARILQDGPLATRRNVMDP